MHRSTFLLPVVATLLALAVPGAADETGYRTPPQVLVDLIDRPLTPRVEVSPDQRYLLLLERPSLPSIAELAAPELRLGGARIDPRTNGLSRRRPYAGLLLVRVADGATRAVSGLPENPRIEHPRFSPDGARVAFTHTAAERIELWVASLDDARARRLSDVRLNLAAGVAPAWSPDGKSLYVLEVPADRGPAPAAPEVPAGPVIQDNDGAEAPSRTYQDLLKNPHDEALFAHYLGARLARVGLDGTRRAIGPPALYWDVDPSPDGRFLLVEILHRPFSYLRPAYYFPRRVEVWDADGDRVRTVADLPLREEIPVAFGSVATGPREHGWRADADATLYWAEALDGGDAGHDAPYRDRLFLWPAPFASDPVPWVALENRLSEVLWARDDLAVVVGWWWKTRNLRVTRARPGAPDAPPERLFDYSWEDRYNDPGTPLLTADARGRKRLRTGPDGDTLYLVGDGASPEGDRPFLDAFDLETRETRRLFRSAAPHYELPIELLGAETPRLLTRRESVTEPPDYFVRALSADAAPRRLTAFPHPAPELAGFHKELIRYARADGVPLTATLYLPPGYRVEDGPLPMLMWAYPEEFKSADAAGQVTDSPYRFDRIHWSSALLWLTQGYAVLDDPSMPIVGEGDDEPNDTFRDQLVASAEAAVKEAVRRGVASADRIAIGGHSYGAFMTANLLAHSDLFAAGIARSGAYNRTLTPFGFQSEERTLWQAPEVYFAVSPFMHADKIDEPLLLIHGDSDNNSGTFPMQSERMYNALKGHGATARLVMLPHESHGYRARESVLHMLWETHRWLERYVKGNGVEPPPSVERQPAAQGVP